jgi:hypothetical protein
MVEKHGNSSETITEEVLRDYIIYGSLLGCAQINDSFSGIVWVSTYFMVNRNRS